MGNLKDWGKMAREEQEERIIRLRYDEHGIAPYKLDLSKPIEYTEFPNDPDKTREVRIDSLSFHDLDGLISCLGDVRKPKIPGKLVSVDIMPLTKEDLKKIKERIGRKIYGLGGEEKNQEEKEEGESLGIDMVAFQGTYIEECVEEKEE